MPSERSKKKGETLHADAVEWCVSQALGPSPTASQVLELTTSLSNAYESREKAWEQVPGLAKRWQTIHENPLAPSLLEFLLVGTPNYFVTYNREKKAENAEHVDWCGPMLEPAYVSVCSKTLAKLPELVGAEAAMRLCKERLVHVNSDGLPLQMRIEIREEAIQTATAIINNTRGLGLRACLEHALAISTAYVLPSLPSADRLLAAGLDAMDAKIEGRARVIASNDEEFAGRWGSVHLLSSMLDAYLSTTKSDVLDRRVLELCNRADAHLLLFFGSRFAKHLCLRRQAELHTFLGQLATFPAAATLAQDFEFFHWELPEHSLASLTALPSAMLHPATQALLLQKGLLGNTLLPTLTALPTLAYVDTNPNVLGILDAHPRPQSPAKAVDPSLKPLNPKDPNDLNELVQCRYRSLAPPTRSDDVQQRHVDTLILALGHADHTDRAMVVLSKYAGWHKFARDALVRTIKTLSKPHARRVLAQLVTPSKDSDEKMGLSTLVHMLRLALELRVDRVVDLCNDAFRGGQCHRDVLAVMLTKLVVLEDLSEEELRTIRSLYNISSTSRDNADQLYIVRTTLQDIKNLKPWTLPFVCEVISTDWCYVPGAASEAFSALMTAAQCGAPVTAVVEAMTCMLRSARVLANVEFHDSHTLAADWKSVDSSRAAGAFRGQTNKLAECNLVALRALVREVFSGPTQDLDSALSLWVPLAKDDLKEVDWVAARIKEFMTKDLGGAFQALVDITIREGGPEVAKKAVHIAREAVGPTTPQGVKLLISGWAKLVARDSDKAALEALLRDATANENVIAVARVLFHGPHRWQALEWLSRSRPCSEAPAPGLSDLVDLGEQVFAEKKATLEDVKQVLELMASHGDSPLCITLIQKLAEKGPANRDVQRVGLQWLTPLFPRAAVQLYPKFLSRFEPHSVEDVDNLLALCVSHDLEVPPLTQGVCRVGCASLLKSPRVEARVLAARALGKDQRFEELKRLLADPSAVVRSAAQSLLPSATPSS